MAGKSLDVRKGESARYQIDRLNNQIAWAGDKETASSAFSLRITTSPCMFCPPLLP